MNALSSLTDDVQVTVWKRDMQRDKVARLQTYGNTAQGACYIPSSAMERNTKIYTARDSCALYKLVDYSQETYSACKALYRRNLGPCVVAMPMCSSYAHV